MTSHRHRVSQKWCCTAFGNRETPSRAGSGNAHCTIRMSTFSTKDLFDACKKGDIARVRQAVADGVDVRKVVDKNWSNFTPLHYTCWYVACETHPLIWYTLIVQYLYACLSYKGLSCMSCLWYMLYDRRLHSCTCDIMLMGWRICGALVHFGCYQHRYEWKDLWCSRTIRLVSA